MFDFIKAMTGRIPEDIIDVFLNASEYQGRDPWEALQLCMIDYAQQNNFAQFDFGEMSREELGMQLRPECLRQWVLCVISGRF